ncbi:MAG: hypothetical protein QHC88_28160, partial [Achromobacter sp.]|uniref:hypothetical protein n=1 Tax=Achromobacter sp. TaxID=134375 RepID=UPI0029AEADC2
QMISRSPSAVGVLVALGAVGVVSLVQVIKAERTFHQEKRALLEELERRELYEQGGVRFVAPREDPTRP